MKNKSFASDNYATVHPDIMKALVEANNFHEKAYGSDTYREKAIQIFKDIFGNAIDVYFVFNGTGANVLSLSSLCKSYEAILCADSAHINCDECGAPEKFLGSKLLYIKTNDGKIKPSDIEQFLYLKNDQHKIQPRIVSITQTTEWGTVYTIDEIKKIVECAHTNNMYVYLDGARLCNAAAALNVTLKQLITDTHIDVISFGGTKNGMMMGEAVIFLNKELGKDFKYIRKQGMQLMSKMRFISAQFIALLSNNLYMKNASHANSMAQLLGKKLKQFNDITITKKIEANAVFAQLHCSDEILEKIQKEYYFYVWDQSTKEIRLMTSFDITESDIDNFIECLKKYIH